MEENGQNQLEDEAAPRQNPTPEEEAPPPFSRKKKLAHAAFWVAACYVTWLLSVKLMMWVTGN